MKLQKDAKRKHRGQAILEYVILIVVIALAALLLLTAFSDRLRQLIAGVTNTLSNDSPADASQSSIDIVKDLDEAGMDSN